MVGIALGGAASTRGMRMKTINIVCLVIVLLVVFGAEVKVDNIAYSTNFSASGVEIKTLGVNRLLKAE